MTSLSGPKEMDGSVSGPRASPAKWVRLPIEKSSGEETQEALALPGVLLTQNF